MDNLSVGCADSSPYTGEPFRFPSITSQSFPTVILSAAKDLKLYRLVEPEILRRSAPQNDSHDNIEKHKGAVNSYNQRIRRTFSIKYRYVLPGGASPSPTTRRKVSS